MAAKIPKSIDDHIFRCKYSTDFIDYEETLRAKEEGRKWTLKMPIKNHIRRVTPQLTYQVLSNTDFSERKKIEAAKSEALLGSQTMLWLMTRYR